MKNWLKLCFIFGIIIFYIISINIFSNIISFSYSPPQNTQKIIGGDIVELNLGTSTSVSVTRAPKWYGQTNEINGDSYLNLFYVCNLPIKIKKYNFTFFHIIFLITLSLLSVLLFIKQNNKEVKKDGQLEKDIDDIGDFSTSIYN